MRLRDYVPAEDAEATYALVKQLFAASPLMSIETLASFQNTYKGWVVDQGGAIVGALMYSNVPARGLYLDFVCSSCRGAGTLLMEAFVSLVDTVDAFAYLHVERTDAANQLKAWYERYGFRESPAEIVEPLLPSMMAQTVTMTRVRVC